MPGGQVRQGILAQDKEQLDGCAQLGLQLADGVHTVGEAGAGDVYRGQLEVGGVVDSHLEHVHTHLWRRDWVVELVWRACCRNEQHPLQTEREARFLARDEVAVVDGVEGPTQDANSHEVAVSTGDSGSGISSRRLMT